MYGGAKYPRIFSRGVQYFGGYKISCDTGHSSHSLPTDADKASKGGPSRRLSSNLSNVRKFNKDPAIPTRTTLILATSGAMQSK